MIDTHCHIYLEDFKHDLESVLDRAVEAGVNHIFMPSIDFKSIEAMQTLQHPKITFHSMVGVHPCEISSNNRDIEARLSEWASKNTFVGIGETGLDYHWSLDYIKEQKKSLSIHCEIAKAVNKPVILHNRNSTQDMLDIIEEKQNGSLQGIWHCFNGTLNEGKRALDLNLKLGIGGVLTFKNAGVDKTVANLPLEHMLLETDAPYLAPHPKRGKRNEPSFIKYTAERLAEVKGCSIEEIVMQTTQNAHRVFGLNTSN
ncbi:MAG: TatD family hydrolase [Balneolales bacterium]